MMVHLKLLTNWLKQLQVLSTMAAPNMQSISTSMMSMLSLPTTQLCSMERFLLARYVRAILFSSFYAIVVHQHHSKLENKRQLLVSDQTKNSALALVILQY